MEKGFIMLSRKFFSNEMWEAARTFSECEAWLDLIQSARFEATDTIECIGGREITYGRGQYPASNRFLANKWRWGEQKVKTFLSKLKRKGMITAECTQGMNIITLVKYDEYNGKNPPNNPVDNPLNVLINNELKDLVTQLVTQQVAQCQPSGNPNNNKDKKDNNSNSSGSSNELPCGTSQPHVERIDYTALVDFFNSKTNGVFGSLRQPLSDKRKGMVSARIKEHGKKVFVEMIEKACVSNFLKGQNNRNFIASFDWLIKPTNFEKVISGNYDNKDFKSDTSNRDSEDFIRNIAEGISRADLERKQRSDER